MNPFLSIQRPRLREHAILAVFFFFLPALLFSQSDTLTIRSVSIQGLKRTRISTVRHIIKVKEGDIWTKEKRVLVERRLKNSSTFRNVSIVEKIQGTQVDLYFQIQDRWTLFAFPVASTGSGSSLGIGVFEQNFLGTQNTLGAIFLVKEKKPRFFLVYSDPHFISWNWNLTVLGGYQEDRIAEFDQKKIGGGFRLGYRFTDFFSLTGGYQYGDRQHQSDELVPIDGKTQTVSLEMLYNRLFLDEDYTQGQSYRLAIDQELWFSDFNFSRITLDVQLFTRAFANHTLAAQNRLSLSRNAPYGYAFILGGKGGDGTLPIKGYDDNLFVPSQVWSGTLEYRIPFYTSKNLIFSAVGFLDYAFYSENLSQLFKGDHLLSFGPSIRLYLRNLAVPALQLYGAYIPELRRFQIGFALGMGFR